MPQLLFQALEALTESLIAFKQGFHSVGFVLDYCKHQSGSAVSCESVQAELGQLAELMETCWNNMSVVKGYL